MRSSIHFVMMVCRPRWNDHESMNFCCLMLAELVVRPAEERSSSSCCTDDHAVQSACIESTSRQCGLMAIPRPADCGQVMLMLEVRLAAICPVMVSGPAPVMVAESGVR